MTHGLSLEGEDQVKSGQQLVKYVGDMPSTIDLAAIRILQPLRQYASTGLAGTSMHLGLAPFDVEQGPRSVVLNQTLGQTWQGTFGSNCRRHGQVRLVRLAQHEAGFRTADQTGRRRSRRGQLGRGLSLLATLQVCQSKSVCTYVHYQIGT